MEFIAVENTGKREHGRPVFRLLRSLHYAPSPSWMSPVTVPAGFETDFGSVPRIFWRIAAPWDAIEPAAVHDYLCRTKCEPRYMADRYFLIAMADYGMARWRRWLMWLAVASYTKYLRLTGGL